MIDKPVKSWWIFMIFILASDISAIASIKTGFVGTTISESLRSGGLTEGVNSAARYFILGILFTYYIFTSRTNHGKWVALFSIGSSIILILGLVFTVSRTGLVLLPVLAGLILFQPNSNNRYKWVFLFLGIGILLVFVPDSVINIAGSKILPSIIEG